MRRQVRRTTQQQQEALHTSPPAPALSSCDITNEAASAGARLSMRMLPPRSVSPSRAASFASSIGRRSPSSSTSTSAGVVGKCLPTISSRASLRETTAARGASSANSSRRVAGGMAGSGAAKKSTRSDKKPMVNITATDAVVNEAVHQQQHLSSASSGGEAVTITKLTCGAKRSRSSDITTLDTSSSLTTTTLRTDGTPTARRIGGGGEKREKENSTADDDDDDVGTHVMNSVLITNQPTIPKPLDKKHDTLMDGRESPGPSLVVRGGREGREREVCAPTVSTSQICNKGVNGDSDDVNEHDNSPRRRGGQHEVVLDGGTDSSPAFRDHRSFESCASASTYQHSASLFQQPQQEEAKEDAYYPTNTENAPDCSIAVPVVLKNDIKSGGGGGEDMSCSPSSRGGRPTATPLRRDAEAGGVVEGRASVKDRDETKKKEGEGEAAMMDIVMSTTTPQSTDDNFFSLLSFAQRKQLASLLLSQGEKLFITNSSHSTTATKSPPNDDDDYDHNKKNNSISNNTNNTHGEINIIDNRNNIRQSQRYQEEDADKKANEKVHRLLLAGAGNKRVREEGESGDALPLVVQMIEETLCLLKPMLLDDTAYGSYRRAGEDTNSNTNNANCVNRLPASEREALLLLCSSSSSSLSSSSSWSPSSASSAPLQASILNASFVVPQLLKEIDSLQSQLKKKAEEMESVVKENVHYKSFFRIIESSNGLSGKGVEEVTDGTRRSERRQQDTENTSKTPPPSGRPVSIRLEDSGYSQRSSLLGYVPCSSLPASATSTTTSLAPPNPRFSLLTNRGVAGVEAVSSSGGSSSTLLSNATATACHSPIKFKSLEAARAARRAVSFLLPSLTSTRTNGTMPKRDDDGVNCLTNAKEEESVVEDEEGQGKENYQGRLMSTSVAAAGNTGASFQSESLHIDKHAQGSSFDAADGVQQRVSAGDWVGSDLSVSFAFQASEGVNATSPVPSSKRYRSEGAAVSSAHMTPLEKARAANFQLRRSMNL